MSKNIRHYRFKKLVSGLFLLTTACFVVISAAVAMREGKGKQEKIDKTRVSSDKREFRVSVEVIKGKSLGRCRH